MEIILFSIALIVSLVFLFIQTKKLKSIEKLLQDENLEKSILEEKLKNSLELKDKYENETTNLQTQIESLKADIDTKNEKIKELEIKNSALNEKVLNLDEVKSKYENLINENIELKETIKELQTKLKEQEKSFEEKVKLLDENKEKLTLEFKNLANEILEETTKKGEVSFEKILSPLQTQIKDFKEKIEYLNKDESEKISALFNELKNIKELNNQLSTQAQNLTKALKGEVKTQGIWGEMVLYKVLELSGLREDVEYKKEVNLKQDNKTYRPDVIVYLPDNREVIIDAKTSLNAYQEYIATNDESYIKSHIQAIKNHIKTLADKKYENLEGVNSLDFVFMFVPIENALMLALENDKELFEFAFKNRVLLVSPTTLLAALRAIESSWRYERQIKNIQEVIKSAENLYDKVRGFTEDFEKIGKNLDNAKSSFESAKNKLTTGRGNVIRQIEILKEKANIKPKKEITLN